MLKRKTLEQITNDLKQTNSQNDDDFDQSQYQITNDTIDQEQILNPQTNKMDSDEDDFYDDEDDDCSLHIDEDAGNADMDTLQDLFTKQHQAKLSEQALPLRKRFKSQNLTAATMSQNLPNLIDQFSANSNTVALMHSVTQDLIEQNNKTKVVDSNNNDFSYTINNNHVESNNSDLPNSINSRTLEDENSSSIYRGLYRINDVKPYFSKEMINGNKLYTCLWKDCNYKTWKYSQHISRHIYLKHIGIKTLICTIEGCKKVFKRPESLVQHIKNHSCGFGIDTQTMHDPDNVCSVENIRRYFAKTLDNDMHVYQCTFGNCNFHTHNSGSIRRHVHNQHVCPYSAQGSTSTLNNRHNYPSQIHAKQNALLQPSSNDLAQLNQINQESIHSNLQSNLLPNTGYSETETCLSNEDALRSCLSVELQEFPGQEYDPNKRSIKNLLNEKDLAVFEDNHSTDYDGDDDDNQSIDGQNKMLENVQKSSKIFSKINDNEFALDVNNNGNQKQNHDIDNSNTNQISNNVPHLTDPENEITKKEFSQISVNDESQREYQKELKKLMQQLELNLIQTQLQQLPVSSAQVMNENSAEFFNQLENFYWHPTANQSLLKLLNMKQTPAAGQTSTELLMEENSESKPWQCSACSYCTPTKTMLDKHLKTNHPELEKGNYENNNGLVLDPLNSTDNEKSEDENQIIECNFDELNSETEESPFDCHNGGCSGRKYKSRDKAGLYSLKKYPEYYKRKKLPEGNGYQYECTKCLDEQKYTTKSQASMIRHIWQHEPQNFNCPICSKACENEFALYKHKKAEHPEMTSQHNRTKSANKISFKNTITNTDFSMLTQSTLSTESIDNQSKQYYKPMDQMEPISLVMHEKDCYDLKYMDSINKQNTEPIIKMKTSRRNLQFKKYKYKNSKSCPDMESIVDNYEEYIAKNHNEALTRDMLMQMIMTNPQIAPNLTADDL